MNADGEVATLFTMIQKSPMHLSRFVPSGTGLRLLKALTCTPMNREASIEYAMMSTPRAFLAVGITFQPSSDSL